MIKDYAKFSATVAKGIKVGDTEVEIKLLLPLRVMQENFLFLSSNQGEKINVFMGDPQAAFDFDEEDGDIYREVTGRRVITDASGIVMSTEKLGEEDPNQANLFEQQEGVSEGEQKTDDFEIVDSETGEDAVGTQSEDGQHEDGSDLQTEVADLEPGWLNDGAGTDGQDNEGNPDESGEQEKVGNGGSSDPREASADETSKEELDAFILAERPIFPEVEYEGQPIPFPVLLEKRINEDKTWREIANENGMTSGQLSTRWTAYRKLAAKKMKDGGGAA
ncbi:hypothetical protein BK125_18665 [Paenibacillus odorifer]|uniref:Uncharacterized protein n=1 Tax=Paenibacillus odorifer TaxID=189426 RepID=A0ABX3GGY5_9BACL|nr:hypothetical protein [Paenibacillus odorifer]OMC76507.1 hypothetical protein BK125_18665 [Paenibacillus odorifer]OMD18594.1 hypothetical protein BSO21_26345 [Paenibacillus odorifer]